MEVLYDYTEKIFETFLYWDFLQSVQQEGQS